MPGPGSNSTVGGAVNVHPYSSTSASTAASFVMVAPASLHPSSLQACTVMLVESKRLSRPASKPTSTSPPTTESITVKFAPAPVTAANAHPSTRTLLWISKSGKVTDVWLVSGDKPVRLLNEYSTTLSRVKCPTGTSLTFGAMI